MSAIDNEKYSDYVGRISPNIADLGYSHGYADMSNDAQEIINQLYGKMSDEELIEFVSDYLKGYEVGSYISENAEDVYDEMGEMKDEYYGIGPECDHKEEAEKLLRNYIIKTTSGKYIIEQINQQIMELRKLGISVNDISDGYHTFGDYKDMRNAHFIALCNAYPTQSWKSKRHFDEENDPMFNGDFIAGINTPEGPISQHLKMKHWDELCVPEIYCAPEYDGYTEEECKRREKSLTNNKRG